jgi:hypothetical protein
MSQLSLYRPARYRLVVGGHVGIGDSAIWLPNLTCQHSRSTAGMPLTTIEGNLPDHAALHGLLGLIRDWGLPLFLVQRLEIDSLAAQICEENF